MRSQNARDIITASLPLHLSSSLSGARVVIVLKVRDMAVMKSSSVPPRFDPEF